MNETSIVRQNLMTRPDYAPYCGNDIAYHREGGCDNPRTRFDGQQFVCPSCGWKSKFPHEFIDRYKKQWNL